MKIMLDMLFDYYAAACYNCCNEWQQKSGPSQTQKLWQRSAAPTHREKNSTVRCFTHCDTKEGREKKNMKLSSFAKDWEFNHNLHWVLSLCIIYIYHQHSPSPLSTESLGFLVVVALSALTCAKCGFICVYVKYFIYLIF